MDGYMLARLHEIGNWNRSGICSWSWTDLSNLCLLLGMSDQVNDTSTEICLSSFRYPPECKSALHIYIKERDIPNVL